MVYAHLDSDNAKVVPVRNKILLTKILGAYLDKYGVKNLTKRGLEDEDLGSCEPDVLWASHVCPLIHYEASSYVSAYFNYFFNLKS